eukprot:scaffold501_cov105-Isochrysis_galbana.AAC.3
MSAGTHQIKRGEHGVQLLPRGVVSPVHAAQILSRHRSHALEHDRRLQVGHLRHPVGEVVAPRGPAPGILDPRLALTEGHAPLVEGQVVSERLAHARHQHYPAVEAAGPVRLPQLRQVAHDPGRHLHLAEVGLEHEQVRRGAARLDGHLRHSPQEGKVRPPVQLRVALVQSVPEPLVLQEDVAHR